MKSSPSSQNMTSIRFVLDRETKGAVRYQEVNAKGEPVVKDEDGAHIGTFYLRKAALNGNVPRKLSVLVTPE